MSAAEAALRQAAVDLNALGVGWALIGGLAVSARAEPRFTRDVDLAVAVADDREAERICGEFAARSYQILATVEQLGAGRLATTRLRAPIPVDQGIIVDLLFASSGIEREVVQDAEPFEVLAGFVVPLARIGHLIALKLLAQDDQRRPQDGIDLLDLAGVADDEEAEWDRAYDGVTLITDRGFHRERDLFAALEALKSGPRADRGI